MAAGKIEVCTAYSMFSGSGLGVFGTRITYLTCMPSLHLEHRRNRTEQNKNKEREGGARE